MNIFGREGYHASVKSPEGKTWGVDVLKSHGDVFTIELANELLDTINKVWKKGCPDGYYQLAYDPLITFTKIEYDMTDYCLSQSYDGTTISKKIGIKKIGTYEKEKNLLRLWEDDIPVYENNNGRVCQDPFALTDSLL